MFLAIKGGQVATEHVSSACDCEMMDGGRRIDADLCRRPPTIPAASKPLTTNRTEKHVRYVCLPATGLPSLTTRILLITIVITELT